MGLCIYGFDGCVDELWDNEGVCYVDCIVEWIVGVNVFEFFIDVGEKVKDWFEFVSVMGGVIVVFWVWLVFDCMLIIMVVMVVNLEWNCFVLSVGNVCDVMKLVCVECFWFVVIMFGMLFLLIVLLLFFVRIIV